MKVDMYNGELVCHFDDSKHTYSFGGEIWPSVTQATGMIDKPGLRWWFMDQAIGYISDHIRPGKSYDEIVLGETFKEARFAHRKARDGAADIGKLVHKWVEDYIRAVIGGYDQPDLPYNTQAKRCVGQYLEWEEAYQPIYVDTERKLASREYLVAGTADIFALLDDVPTIVDLKTSKGIYPEMDLQTAAYMMMANEEGFHEDQWAQRGILHLPKSAKGWKYHPCNGDTDYEIGVFLGLLGAYKWKNQ